MALAPAESYLDGAARAFNLRLDNAPLAPWAPGRAGFPEEFPYAGRNAYAAILREGGADAFDIVSVQLYEGYSWVPASRDEIDGIPRERGGARQLDHNS